MSKTKKSPPHHPRKPRVAVWLPQAFELFRGVWQYAQTHGGWQIYDAQLGDLTDEQIASGRKCIDGIIVRIDSSDAFAKTALAANVPIVGLQPSMMRCPWPEVMSDNHLVGVKVAEAFMQRRFRNLGIIGYKDFLWSVDRQRGFREHAASASVSCVELSLQHRGYGSGAEQTPEIISWLKNMERPSGIMVVHDHLARRVLGACRAAQIRVPEEIAVISVDNAISICEYLSPQLSSLPLDLNRVGFEGARLLDSLMAGKQPPEGPVHVPPGELVVRQSSDIFATSDPDVSAALHFIASNACKAVTTDDVVNQIAVSRRWLEQKFQREVGRGIRSEIRRVQMDHARMLLRETDIAIAAVGPRCGFATPAVFSRAFHQANSMTPRSYREDHRRR